MSRVIAAYSRPKKSAVGMDSEHFLAGQRLGFDKAGVETDGKPGIFFINVTADNVGMVDG